jgi:hypothetical protein
MIKTKISKNSYITSLLLKDYIKNGNMKKLQLT